MALRACQALDCRRANHVESCFDEKRGRRARDSGGCPSNRRAYNSREIPGAAAQRQVLVDRERPARADERRASLDHWEATRGCRFAGVYEMPDYFGQAVGDFSLRFAPACHEKPSG